MSPGKRSFDFAHEAPKTFDKVPLGAAVDARAKATTNPNPVPVGHPDRGIGCAPELMHFALLHTAMGDTIACLPALIYSARKNPRTRHVVFAGDYMQPFVARALKERGHFQVHPLSKLGKGQETGGLVAVSSARGNVTPIREHLTRYAFTALLDRGPDTDADLEYPQVAPAMSPKSLGVHGDYVAIACNYTSALRAMRQDTLDAICGFLVKRGIQPVLLGASSQDTGVNVPHHVFSTLVAPEGVRDLRNKTSVLAAHAILNGARAVVGMDSGLMHLAATTMVPIVCGFTNASPRARVPYRPEGAEWYSIRPPESLACRGCMTEWDHSYLHDYLSCWHGDAACVDMLPTAGFIDGLVGLL